MDQTGAGVPEVTSIPTRDPIVEGTEAESKDHDVPTVPPRVRLCNEPTQLLALMDDSTVDIIMYTRSDDKSRLHMKCATHTAHTVNSWIGMVVLYVRVQDDARQPSILIQKKPSLGARAEKMNTIFRRLAVSCCACIVAVTFAPLVVAPILGIGVLATSVVYVVGGLSMLEFKTDFMSFIQWKGTWYVVLGSESPEDKELYPPGCRILPVC